MWLLPQESLKKWPNFYKSKSSMVSQRYSYCCVREAIFFRMLVVLSLLYSTAHACSQHQWLCLPQHQRCCSCKGRCNYRLRDLLFKVVFCIVGGLIRSNEQWIFWRTVVFAYGFTLISTQAFHNIDDIDIYTTFSDSFEHNIPLITDTFSHCQLAMLVDQQGFRVAMKSRIT